MAEKRICDRKCEREDSENTCCWDCDSKAECDNPCEKESKECGHLSFTIKPIAKEDIVNHPGHYTQGKFECIEVIEEITKSCSKFEAYLTGTILKYLWRWKFKNGLEDLKKARWYLNKLIEKVESNNDNN